MLRKIKNKVYIKISSNHDNLLSISGILANKLSQVIIQLILVRILTGEEFSEFYFYYAAITGLSMFIGDGIGLAASRLLTLTKTDHQRNIDMAIVSGLLGSLLAGVLVVLQSIFFAPNQISLFLLSSFAIYAISLSFSGVLQYVTTSIGGQSYLSKIQFVFSFFLILFSTLGAYLWSWQGALLGSLICAILSNILLLIKIFKIKDILIVISKDFKKIITLFKNALPICGSMALGGPIHVYCLSVLKISTLDNPTELGIFGISFIVYSLLAFLPSSIGQFLVPWLLKKQNVTPNQSFKYVCSLYFIFGLFLLTLILSANFISLESLSSLLNKTKNTIPLLSIAGFIAGFIALYSFFLNAINKSTSVLLSTIYHSISYLVLTRIFVQNMHLGAVGLALSIMFSFFGQLAILVYIKNRQPKNT